MSFIGIDLAGKVKNPTGIAAINTKTFIKEVYSDEDILKFVDEHKPEVVAIDAPFSIPEDEWRGSDDQLRQDGFKPLSPRFPTMQLLSRRAQKLVAALRKKYKVIETFSRAIEETLALDKTGVEHRLEAIISDHQYDAFLCALTAKALSQEKTKMYGNPHDPNDQIHVPENE